MTNKFTEEQYQIIVEIGKQYHDDRMRKTEILLDYLYDDFGFKGGAETEPLDQAMAIANPLTREWAYEQFVEKEKQYVWRDKYTGYVIYKMLNDWSLSATALGEKHFTETELKDSPFKPEWFDKEEVD